MEKFTYASAFNLTEDPLSLSSAVGSSSSSSFATADDDLDDDACSICLEPFTVQDPATVTSCKHEYHLQCILEWSQRSKECPICWQLFVLKDPSSQELLAAVEKERLSKPKNVPSASSRSILSPGDLDGEEDASHSISFEERLMWHLTDASHRGYMLRRRDRQRSSRLPSSNAPISISSSVAANTDQAFTISQDGHQNASSYLSSGSAASAIPSPVNAQPPPSNSGDSSGPADGNNKFRLFLGSSPSHSSQSPNSPETFSLPDTIKSKLSAASARYKESISKSKQDLKEKLLARNNSLKELSNGVQREMNAGIAGVARMFERLDLASKRFGASMPVSAASTGTRFNFSFKGKRVEENPDAETLNNSNGDRTEIPHPQGGQTD